MPVDLLVFGPHPDDLEIGLAGTIARHTAQGYSVGLCDLTRGELGSNGTPEERVHEAENAAKVLGAAWRENLGWPDGGIVPSADLIRSAIDHIRHHQPKAIAVPYWDDRHPDHGAASRVLDLAIFQSALRKYASDAAPWRADWTCYYFINNSTTPSFVVDVSDYYEKKRLALACHRTQFAPAGTSAVPTRLTASSFQRLIESRDAQFGSIIGVEYAEGLVVREPITRATLFREDE